VARRISHPNVCRVYDLGQSQGVHFISMELLDGETLEARLQREDFTERGTVDVLRQIVAGLDAAHRGGVIHRDLKPANIMISARGHVTVMDFGLARDVHSESTERRHGGGSIVGTPAYWSPEQGRGERATPASDLYSLGVIACRMFNGSHGRLKRGQDPLLGVREPYRSVIARCMEPDPSKRFASADAVQLALAAAQRDRRPTWIPYVLGAGGTLAVAAAFLALRSMWSAPPPSAALMLPSPSEQRASPEPFVPPSAQSSGIPIVSVESLPTSPAATGALDPAQHPSPAIRPHVVTAPRSGPHNASAPAGSRIPIFDMAPQPGLRDPAAPAATASSRIPVFE
jgi:serine/threonine protein kinase